MIGKKWLVTIAGIVGITTSAVAVLAVKGNEWFNSTNSINLLNKKFNTEVIKDDLQPFEQFNESPILTQKTGPIISWGSEIKSLDWFGAERWKIDLLSDENKNLFPKGINTDLVQYRNRAFISWDLDVTNNVLWLLMNTSKKTASNQSPNYNNIHAGKVVKINSLTGKIDRIYEWKDSNDQVHKFRDIWRLYYQISTLSNGNVLLFSQVENGLRKSVVLDTKTGKFNEYSTSSASVDNAVMKTGGKKAREVRNNFLVPIANNLNILAVVDFNTHRDRSDSTATGDVYLLLVKDDLSIHDTKDTNWKNFIHIKNVFAPWKSLDTDPVINRSIYRTFDNKVYFTIYNKFFVVDTKLNKDQGIDFAEYDLANSGKTTASKEIIRPKNTTEKVNAISSYAIDANENVYYKLINDPVIYNLKISKDKSDVKKTTFASTTYYDISKHTNEIVKDNANSFVLFNVTGSTGALFALNAKVINNGERFSKELEKYKDKNYGLALAITPSQTNSNVGDVLGFLNTSNKFIKPADFSIDNSILSSKLPSEITVGDLTVTNGFLTNNQTKKESSNELAYLPFEISEINDKEGKFKIKAYLDQIPWFSNKLQDESVPRLVEHDFQTTNKITNKISWIDQQQISYNFKNTLPSKVTINELDEYDLFKPSFVSKTVLDANGKVLYPKKKYEVTDKKDSDGTIKITATYEYVPLGVNYKDHTSVLKVSDTKTYTIFKETDTPKLQFAGANQVASNQNNPIDLSKIAVLKNFLQSSYLPSSIKDLIETKKIDFINFLDLNNSSGFPTNKMKYELDANDDNGTLTFKVKLQDGYYVNKNHLTTSFEQTFTNLNKKANYSFKFKQNLKETLINNEKLNSYLPSSITSSNVFEQLVEITGFNIKDFDIDLTPNDIEGKLDVTIKLNKSYPVSIGNSNHGFNNYIAKTTIDGFLTRNQFDNLFNITFKKNNDETLAKLKELTPKTIEDRIKAKNLMINEKKYESLEQLVKDLLVDKAGKLIPNDWSKDNGIEVETSYDNNAGNMLFLVRINPTDKNEIKTPLNFAISYSEFARGNKVETADSLSFVSNALFQTLRHNGNKLNKQNIGQYIKENGIDKLLSSNNGQYASLIKEGNYEVKLNLSSLFNGVDLQVIFDNVSNSSSLKTYSNTFVFEQ